MYFSNQIKAKSIILFVKVRLFISLQPLWELQNKIDFDKKFEMQSSINPDYIGQLQECFSTYPALLSSYSYNQ